MGDPLARALGELAALRQDLASATMARLAGPSVDLVEANEHLVLAALRARTEAEDARESLQEVSRTAELDPLTGLPNRILLMDRLNQAIAVARRQGTRLALLFLDLDNFKQINDTLGHVVGDRVLRLVADRIVTALRESDTVSRHGGDEFLILVSEISAASDAELVAAQVMAALAIPCEVDDQQIVLSASIGISYFPDHGDDADSLVQRADAAMYLAKRQGPGHVAVDHAMQPMTSGTRELSETPLCRELREANEQLVLAALRAQDLQASAQQAHRSEQELLAVVAHELRSPLTPIRMAAGLLDRVPMEELPHMQAIIEREVMHMLRLVSDLLDLSRANTGKLRVELGKASLGRIVEEAVHACLPAMERRHQHLSVVPPDTEIEVHGDAIRLSQVVRNLLDNASKYTQMGGEIRISTVVRGTDAVITVSDNGIGIPAETLPRVFEPFTQDPDAVGFNGVGLGIGLTVVRELVAAHGGTVVARSDGYNQGSEFVVVLPLLMQAKARENGALNGSVQP